jgi:hypothetical protein
MGYIYSESKRERPPDFFKATFIMAFVIGVCGFITGYYASLYIFPNSELGPLLGLISGPLSFLFGMVIGIIRVVYEPFQKTTYKALTIIGSTICFIGSIIFLLAIKYSE